MYVFTDSSFTEERVRHATRVPREISSKISRARVGRWRVFSSIKAFYTIVLTVYQDSIFTIYHRNRNGPFVNKEVTPVNISLDRAFSKFRGILQKIEIFVSKFRKINK